MGGFITFAAPEPTSARPFTQLSGIPAGTNLTRFARTIPVTNSTRFSLGEWVRIFINDDSTTGTCDHLGFCRRRRLLQADHGRESTAGRAGRQIRSQQHAAPGLNGPPTSYPNDPSMPPPWLEALGGSSRPGGVQAQGALSAGFVEIAARPGTIADWIYGEGGANSGPGNLAVDRDTVTFTAKVVSKTATSITLDRPLPFPIKPAWRGAVHRLVAPLQFSGVEHLTIEFVWTKTKQHLRERGYNALQFEGVRNCWVKNVTILNSDTGIHLHSVDHSTLTDVTVNVTRTRTFGPPDPHHLNGHHPISIYHGHYNLVTRVNIAASYAHDITVARATMLNVISQSRGYNLCLDHHRGGPFGNLFSDIDLGCGYRPFGSSGLVENGAYSGRGETFWNLRATSRCPPHPRRPTPRIDLGWFRLPGCDFGPHLNFVGKFQPVLPQCPTSRWFTYLTFGGRTVPPDLHLAQKLLNYEITKLERR